MWPPHPSFLRSEFILVSLTSLSPPAEDLHSVCSSGKSTHQSIHVGKAQQQKKKPLPLFLEVFFSLLQVRPGEGAQCCGWHSRGSLLEQDKDTCAGLSTAQCSEIRESSSPGRDGCKETTQRAHGASAMARLRNGNRICFSHGLGTM